MSSSTHDPKANGEDRAAFWRKHVSDWRKSGLSTRQYCEKHGLNRGTFGYWSSRLRTVAAEEPPRFLPVQVAAPTTAAAEPPAGDAGVVVELADGVSVRVARGFDAETLARVLAVVRR